MVTNPSFRGTVNTRSKWLIAGIVILCLVGIGALLLVGLSICGLGSLVLLSLPSGETSGDSSDVPIVEASPVPVLSTISPTPGAYPPQQPYADKSVQITVKRIDSGTILVTNNGGIDAPALKKVWVNVYSKGYMEPNSGEVTSQAGSSACYKVSEDSLITVTGEFADTNSVLWSGIPAVPTAVPTIKPVVSPTPKAVSATPSGSDYYERTYKWSYKNYHYTWELSIPEVAYDYYQNKPHNRESDYAMYAMSSYDRQYLQSLVTELEAVTEEKGYTEQDAALMTIAFVQSMEYTSDSVTTGYDEYPRYPIETMVDNGGDCEDTAILTAALLNEMGYGVVLLRLPGHMAVGVKGSDDYPGTYWEYKGTRYYYLETTGEGWKVGQIPPEYQNAKATIYPMQQVPMIDLNFTATCTGSDYYNVYYRVHCDYENIGTGTAQNVSLYFAARALSQGSDRVWSPDQDVNLGDCAEGGSGWAEATLKIPLNEQTQIECIAYGDNFEPTVEYSTIFDT